MGDTAPILTYASERRPRDWRGWAAAVGCGLIVGLLLGMSMIGAFDHMKWAVFAGIAVGVASGLIVRSFAVFAALGGGIVTVIICVSVVALNQVRVGHWPITDPQTIVHYGSPAQAVLRVAVILMPVVCVPCAASAALVAFVRRRAA